MLQIAVEKVCDLIINSLALDASLESGGDDFTEIPDIDDNLEFAPPKEDGYDDLKRIIEKLNEEERQHLVALVWVGRGTFSVEEWEDALQEAAGLNDEHISDYLVKIPQLGDYLEEGLSELGYSSEGFETGIR